MKGIIIIDTISILIFTLSPTGGWRLAFPVS